MKFTNKDLKPGMFAELKNGVTGVLIPCYEVDKLVDLVVVSGSSVSSRQCTARLLDGGQDDSIECAFSIVRVFDLNYTNAVSLFSNAGRTLLWEYKEPKKLTKEEIESLLGYPIEIVEEV